MKGKSAAVLTILQRSLQGKTQWLDGPTVGGCRPVCTPENESMPKQVNYLRGHKEVYTSMENKTTTVSQPGGTRWCILRHPDSELIGEILSGKRKVFSLSEDDQSPLPPFEHYIPFSDLDKAPARPSTADDFGKHYDPVLDERAMRSDLHRFIFIRASKELVKALLDAPWNRALRHPVFTYRDENGEPIEVSDQEVQQFRQAIMRQDFQLLNGDAVDDVSEGDKVVVVNGPMKGREGEVTQIRERDGNISLTIAFRMFQQRLRIAVPGFSIGDVRLVDSQVGELLQDPVISNFEDQLIEKLCHLHGKKGSKEMNKEDRKRLRFLYQYSNIVFEDNEDNRKKFAALMLICVYLMNDKDAVKERIQEVENLLDSEIGSLKAEVGDHNSTLYTLHSPLSTELSCYLTTALFIVTHNPELRRKTKMWRQAHPDCSLSLRRFLSIAKHIRC